MLKRLEKSICDNTDHVSGDSNIKKVGTCVCYNAEYGIINMVDAKQVETVRLRWDNDDQEHYLEMWMKGHKEAFVSDYMTLEDACTFCEYILEAKKEEAE